MDMDELEYEIFEKGELVKRVTIQQIRPCIVDENRIRVLMQLDSKIEEVIPLLVSKYPPGNVNYIENKKILTLNLYGRLVTLYPSGKVSMNKTIDKEDSIEVITGVITAINQAYVEIDSGDAVDYSEMKERLSKVGPLSIYNCLPKTDCLKCGEKTCMAFAIKLLSGDNNLDKCTPLIDQDYKDNLECLEELLGSQIMQSMGWNGLNLK